MITISNFFVTPEYIRMYLKEHNFIVTVLLNEDYEGMFDIKFKNSELATICKLSGILEAIHNRAQYKTVKRNKILFSSKG